MKKLFTLVALLAVFMGAKAEWVEDYSIDYSTKDNFPFFVMGYVPEWVGGVMTDYGANYRYATQADLDGDGDAKWKDGESSVGTVMAGSTEYQKVEGAGPYWHQYFIADGIPTELDGSYTVKAMVKASEAVTINVNMGWNWSGGVVGAQVAIGTEWAEVEWEYSGIGGTSCNLVAQPGGSTATIEWKWVKVSHNAKPSKPTVWQQWLTNDGNSIIPEVAHTNKYVGDAETAWPAWALETTDGINANWRGEQPNLICAWALTMGRNFDNQCPAEVSGDSYRARPFPADIELEPGSTTNHVFAVHVTQIDVIDAPTPDANSIAWSNQFWIESPKSWKEGEQVKIKFRYKADHACKVGTQIHKQRPSDYLHWQAVGDVSFTTEWQEFEKVVTFTSDQAGGFSLAFNLCSDADNGRTPNVFYFDDLSWETMKLDEGFFVAGANTEGGLQYDFDNAIEFTWDDEDDAYAATIGDPDDEDTWVNEIMISTVRGNDAAFKSKTLKPSYIKNDPDEWPAYTESSLAKLKLPGTGAWRILIDTEELQMNFVMIAGKAKEAKDVVTNDTPITINGQEREDLIDSWDDNKKELTVREEADNNPENEHGVGGPGHNGQTWDNQFFIKANRALVKGEVTMLKFKYKASAEAKATTQCHGETPGAYKHWAAIGDVNFTTEWQKFEKEFTVPNEADGMWNIAFNLAEYKGACVYEIKDVQWYLYDATLDEGKTWENLVNATGDSNFYIKEGAGTNPYVPSGIIDVINDATIRTDVIYNLSGQRVSKDYKGIVIMNGRKVVNK